MGPSYRFRTSKWDLELHTWTQNSRFVLKTSNLNSELNSRIGFQISELDSELQIWIQKLRFGFRTEDLDSELQTLKFGNEY